MEFTENKEPEVTKVCNSCELAKPTRHTRKGTNKRETKVGMKLHIDVVRLKPKGIKNQHWAAVITDDASRARWVQCYEHKNKAFNTIK